MHFICHNVPEKVRDRVARGLIDVAFAYGVQAVIEFDGAIHSTVSPIKAEVGLADVFSEMSQTIKQAQAGMREGEEWKEKKP